MKPVGLFRYIIGGIVLLFLPSEVRAFNDPVTGRWITRDPIGYSSGSANLYELVKSNPIYWVDPTGLSNRNTRSELLAYLKKLCRGECTDQCKEAKKRHDADSDSNAGSSNNGETSSSNGKCKGNAGEKSGRSATSQGAHKKTLDLNNCVDNCIPQCEKEALALWSLVLHVVNCSRQGTEDSNCSVFGIKLETELKKHKWKYFKFGVFRPIFSRGNYKRPHVVTGITTISNTKKAYSARAVPGYQIWDLIIDPVDWNRATDNDEYDVYWDFGHGEFEDALNPGNYYDKFGPHNPGDPTTIDPGTHPKRFPGAPWKPPA